MIRALKTLVHQLAVAGPACIAAASAVAADERLATIKPGVGASEILSLATSLIVVIGAILVVGWLYARTQGIRSDANGAIRIVASQSLGPKERILVVDIAGQQLVVGMTASHIQTLHVLDGRVVNESVSASASTFAERFRSVLKGVGK